MYGYDGQDLIFETDENGNALAIYTHSNLRIDDPLSKEVTSLGVSNGISKNAKDYYYLKDSLGTITDIVDSTGTLIQHYTYSVFGTLLEVTDVGGNSVTSDPEVRPYLTFTGREWDNESEMLYFRARYYEPTLGRFISRDIYNESFNRYAYSRNNTTNRIDPTGDLSLKGSLGYLVSIFTLPGADLYYANTSSEFSTSDRKVINGIAIGMASAGVGGAAGGFFTSGISGFFAGAASGAITGGLSGGVLGKLNGSGFSSGFRSGAIIGAISGGIAGFKAARLNAYIQKNRVGYSRLLIDTQSLPKSSNCGTSSILIKSLYLLKRTTPVLFPESYVGSPAGEEALAEDYFDNIIDGEQNEFSSIGCPAT